MSKWLMFDWMMVSELEPADLTTLLHGLSCRVRKGLGSHKVVERGTHIEEYRLLFYGLTGLGPQAAFCGVYRV